MTICNRLRSVLTIVRFARDEQGENDSRDDSSSGSCFPDFYQIYSGYDDCRCSLRQHATSPVLMNRSSISDNSICSEARAERFRSLRL